MVRTRTPNPNPDKTSKGRNPDKCGAKTRKGGSDAYPGEPGRPCGLAAGHGTPNRSGPCKLHGGAGAGAKMMAARKDAEKAATRELQKLNLWGARRDISPIEALAEELERTAGRVTAIEQRLTELPEGDDTPRARGLAAELTAERGQLQRVAEAANRAGVTERRSEVAQDQALQIAALMRATLADLELSPAQQQVVPALMRWHFAELGGQAVGPRPPRPSELPPEETFDLEAARARNEAAQSGEPTPAPPAAPTTSEPDHGRLIELRSVVDRSRTSHIDGRI